jgi:hypothetical protein
MSKAKTTVSTVSLKKRHPTATPQKKSRKADDAICRACIGYAFQIAGSNAAFKADPTGNNEYAGPRDDISLKTSRAYLARVAALPAETMIGLEAKARLLPIMLDDLMNCGAPETEQAAFLRSFAADVQRLASEASGSARAVEVGADLTRGAADAAIKVLLNAVKGGAK